MNHLAAIASTMYHFLDTPWTLLIALLGVPAGLLARHSERQA